MKANEAHSKEWYEVLKREAQGYSDWRRKNEPARLEFEASRKAKIQEERAARENQNNL